LLGRASLLGAKNIESSDSSSELSMLMFFYIFNYKKIWVRILHINLLVVLEKHLTEMKVNKIRKPMGIYKQKSA